MDLWPKLRLWVKLEEGVTLPERKYGGDAGLDLVCRILDDNNEPSGVYIEPHEFADIGTGIRIACPTGFWAEIRGRSSAAWKKRLIVHQGVIDEGFRGELRVLVQNLNGGPVVVEHGERLAQLILHRRETPEIVIVEDLPASPDGRGEAGFGSTGR